MKKTVLITGASRGIGAECAKIFAKNNFNIVINYNRSEAKANLLADQLAGMGANVVCIKADVSSSGDVQKMINEVKACFGCIDVLVNNAGVSSINLLCDTSDDEIDNQININTKGTILTTKYALDIMAEGSKIVNISSVWGEVGGSCESVYSATKGAVISFTKAMAKELALKNICVNCVAPGVIDTDMNNHLSDAEKAELATFIPLGRFGLAKEVAEVVWFLSGDGASYITGAVIPVNGGWQD